MGYVIDINRDRHKGGASGPFMKHTIIPSPSITLITSRASLEANQSTTNAPTYT